MPQGRPLTALAAVLLAAACGRGAPEGSFEAAMAREHAGDRPAASPAAAPPAAEVAASKVEYGTVEGKAVEGFLARPAGAEGPLPGVLVIHEWWGLNDNIRSLARRLAGEGYLALAVDLYRGQVAEDPGRARELAQASRERHREIGSNLQQAHRYLTGVAGAGRVGVVGWCFGGGWALRAALLLPREIDAAVVYYGRLETDPGELARLEAPLLGHFGAEDRGIPLAAVREFQRTLEELGKPAEIHVYPGADHAFANPSGGNYDAAAAERAWERTLAFFAAHLEG